MEGLRILRNDQESQVEVVVQAASGERRFGPVASTAESDLAAVVPVTGLAPATRHPYRVLVDGQSVPMPDGAAITTAPALGQPGCLTLAFGSCLHKTGLGNRALLDRMRLWPRGGGLPRKFREKRLDRNRWLTLWFSGRFPTKEEEEELERDVEEAEEREREEELEKRRKRPKS